jgi:glucokinase
MALLIGIDVGGTNLRLGLVALDVDNSKPHLLQEQRVHADFSGLCKRHPPELAWKKILETLAAAIRALCREHSQVCAVGIGFPGFIEPHTQKIAQSPNLPGLCNVDLSQDLSSLIGLPVVTENDALAAAYGEFTVQIASKPAASQHLIYLGLGTGVGGGLILNQKPFQGQNGVAMEVGHIITEPHGRLCGCGNYGCMERYASASGVAFSYQQATGTLRSAAEIAELAQAGDTQALAAYALAGKSLAQALAHILKVIDVTDVVIGGGMSAAWPLLKSSFENQLNQDLIPVFRGKIQIQPSHMGDTAGMIGAAMLAVQPKSIL